MGFPTRFGSLGFFRRFSHLEICACRQTWSLFCSGTAWKSNINTKKMDVFETCNVQFAIINPPPPPPRFLFFFLEGTKKKQFAIMWLFLSLILGDHLCIILGKGKERKRKRILIRKKKPQKLKVVYYCNSWKWFIIANPRSCKGVPFVSLFRSHFLKGFW